eukprot:6172146-Amphidinium_carterae.1
MQKTESASALPSSKAWTRLDSPAAVPAPAQRRWLGAIHPEPQTACMRLSVLDVMPGPPAASDQKKSLLF